MNLKRILLITRYKKVAPPTILEHVNAIKKLKGVQIDEVNITSFNRIVKKWLKLFPVPISSYDQIILHNTVTASMERLLTIDEFFKPALSKFKGDLVLMKQDELRRMNQTLWFIDHWNIKKITTCVPKSEWNKVYNLDLRPNIKLFATYTGYVTEAMRQFKHLPLKERQFDVTYRGQFARWYYGRLGYEKYSIGEDFKINAAKTDLKIDISSQPEDRLYGRRWIDFLNNSRCTLGVESGGSIFDFDGKIEENCENLRAREPHLSFYQASEKLALEKHENLISYGQIAPRHIEAAYTRTSQILFPGEFNGLLKNNESCIFIERDFSNFNEVKNKIKKLDYLEFISNNAFRHIIQNEELWYTNFTKNFETFLSS